MINDPIVEEVHKVRRELFEKCDNDLSKFFEFIRQSQAKHGDRLITSLKNKKQGDQSRPVSSDSKS